MSSDNILEKTNRINLLFDFYQTLLTARQQLFLKYYFHDNFSLGEIAQEFGISRQAVYEHVKRAGTVLEDYEAKLRLLNKHEERLALLERLDGLAVSLPAATSGEWQRIRGRLAELD